jgi:hypothetical protein
MRNLTTCNIFVRLHARRNLTERNPFETLRNVTLRNHAERSPSKPYVTQSFWSERSKTIQR